MKDISHDTCTPNDLSSKFVDRQSASLCQALDALHRANPEADFQSMLVPLLEAGMSTLNDVVVCGVVLVVSWTGLPNSNVADLVAYAQRCKALNHITRQTSPESEVGHSDRESNTPSYSS